MPNVCASCLDNFLLDTVGNACVASCGVDFCLVCSSPSECAQCAAGYIILSSSCVVLC